MSLTNAERSVRCRQRRRFFSLDRIDVARQMEKDESYIRDLELGIHPCYSNIYRDNNIAIDSLLAVTMKEFSRQLR